MPPCPIGSPSLAAAAGLFAAERLRAAGLEVDLYEAKGSPGRKFLIAGKGGLNLTHSDPRPLFDSRYREQAAVVGNWLDGFDAQALRDWAAGLGVETYVGSSGRVFPVDRKAAPLLRGWVRRLKEQGVRLHANHRWIGWSDDGALRFATEAGKSMCTPMPRYWRWAAVAGRSWAVMAPGSRHCRRVAWTSRRCSQPIVASTWTGRRSLPSAMPAHH